MGSSESRITESHVRSLFESKLKECPTAAATDDDDDEVAMVIIVHRHGARFPTKEMSSDISWPADDAFWNQYGANLTPVGSMQAYALGCSLHERYAKTKLFRNIERKDIGKHVKVQTSNKHRTLFTAWNVLRGMFPGVGSYFNYWNDRLDLNMEDMEKNMNKKGNKTLGIPINVEKQEKNDELLHQIKTAPDDVIKFKKTNVEKCDFFDKIEKDKAYLKLLDKLYEMSEEKCFDKETTKTRKSLAKVKKIANQLNIARNHNMPEFPNRHGIELSDEEKEMIQNCAKMYWKYMYRPAKSNKVSDGIGKDGCGHLAGEIARLMLERMEGQDDEDIRFVEYSAHDTTVLALASLLGVDIDHPEFCGYWLFELRKSSADDWNVAVYYNADPMVKQSKAMCSRVLPLDGYYTDYSSLPKGKINATKLVSYMSDNGQLLCVKILRAIGQIAIAISKNSMSWKEVLHLSDKMDKKKLGNLKATFDFYDADHSGYVDAKELDVVFRKLGLDEISHSTVLSLVHFFDRDGDFKLSQEEFLCMMSIVFDCVRLSKLQLRTKSGRSLLDLEKKISDAAQTMKDLETGGLDS